MAKGKKVEVAEEKVVSTKNTSVRRCTCKHAYQDKHYGRGKRLFNKTGVAGKGSGWRCTVCGNTVVV